MATDVSYFKNGIRIQCSTSRYPAPRPVASWPTPLFPCAESSLLSLTLATISGQAISGVQVQSVGILPGSAKADWTLFHQFYQGAPAVLPTPDSIPVTLVGGALNLTLATPMAGATHLFWLQKVEGVQTVTYPSTLIITPADPSAAALAAATASAAAVAGEMAVVTASTISGLVLVYLAGQLNLQWSPLLTAPDAAYEVRMGAKWASALTLGQTPGLNFTTITDGTYWVAPLFNGAYGTPVSITVTGTTLLTNSIIAWDESIGWPGTLAGSAINQQGNITLTPGAGTTTGSYTTPASHIVNVGTPQVCTIGVAYSIVTAYSTIMVSSWPSVSGQTDVEQSAPAGASGNTGFLVQISIDTGSGSFGPWTAFTPGQYYGQRFQMRINLNSSTATIDPFLMAFSWSVSLPDRIARGSGTTLTTGPLPFTFPIPFQVIPVMHPSILNMQPGDTITYSPQPSTTGFGINVQNLGVNVVRDISWMASGY